MADGGKSSVPIGSGLRTAWDVNQRGLKHSKRDPGQLQEGEEGPGPQSRKLTEIVPKAQSAHMPLMPSSTTESHP